MTSRAKRFGGDEDVEVVKYGSDRQTERRREIDKEEGILESSE